MPKLRLPKDAQRVLNEFPEELLWEIIMLANSFRNSDLRNWPDHIKLPDGWNHSACQNAILLRYEDGEQEKTEFFVPAISIFFLDGTKIIREVITRLQFGFCSCGKPIKIIRQLLRANDNLESEHWPDRMIGVIQRIFLKIKLTCFPIHQWSLLFNRHLNCL